jgi:protein TonB
MEIKKTSKADLEKGKTLALLMGAIVALAVLFVGFEWGTRELKIDAKEGIADIFAEEEIEITTQEAENTPPPPPPPPPQQEVVAEVLTIVEDNVDVGNQTLMSSEDTQREAQTQTYVPPTVVAAVVVEEEISEQQIFEIVEEMPEFPGGPTAMMSFLNSNLKYPVVAQENGIQGRVTCAFVVNQDGSIVDIEVLRGLDPSLDKEAMRVISTMPKWKPGKQRNKPVRVKFNLPIFFRLQQ